MKLQIFQQVISLGPRCRAKHHIRLNFGHHVSKRGAFDWQITPPAALLEYFRNDFRGTFERQHLKLALDGRLVKHALLETEHPHQFPKNGMTEADLDEIYPLAEKTHEDACKATREAVANGLSTLFVFGDDMPTEVVDEIRSHLKRINPNRPFLILLPPDGDANTVDDWSGDPDLWKEHLAPYAVVPPLTVRLKHHLAYRIRKNLGYLLPVSLANRFQYRLPLKRPHRQPS